MSSANQNGNMTYAQALTASSKEKTVNNEDHQQNGNGDILNPTDKELQQTIKGEDGNGNILTEKIGNGGGDGEELLTALSETEIPNNKSNSDSDRKEENNSNNTANLNENQIKPYANTDDTDANNSSDTSPNSNSNSYYTAAEESSSDTLTDDENMADAVEGELTSPEKDEEEEEGEVDDDNEDGQVINASLIVNLNESSVYFNDDSTLGNSFSSPLKRKLEINAEVEGGPSILNQIDNGHFKLIKLDPDNDEKDKTIEDDEDNDDEEDLAEVSSSTPNDVDTAVSSTTTIKNKSVTFKEDDDSDEVVILNEVIDLTSSPEVSMSFTPQKKDIVFESPDQSFANSFTSTENDDSQQNKTINNTINESIEQQQVPTTSSHSSIFSSSPLEKYAIPVDSVEKLLPKTVTKIDGDLDCCDVYLVGTAHFSEESQSDVIKTIQLSQPGIVILELCCQRQNLLLIEDEQQLLTEAAKVNIGTIRQAIRQAGLIQGLLNTILLGMSAQLTKQLGMAPGGEFRVARKEAMKIPNCTIVLGDRPLSITLSRALFSLSIFQRIKLAYQFITNLGGENITRDEVERCKEKDLIESMMEELTGEYPGISRVFLHERDYYLSHIIHAHARNLKNYKRALVAVVGMGHVQGIISNWGKTNNAEMNNISQKPEETLTSKIIRKSIKITFYSLLAYGSFKLIKKGLRMSGVTLANKGDKEFVSELLNKLSIDNLQQSVGWSKKSY